MRKLDVLIRGVDQFSAPAKKVGRASEGMARRLDAGQRELAKLGKQSKAIDRLRGLENRVGRTAAEMDKMRRRTAALGREIAGTEKPTKKLQQQFDAARKATGALQKKHRDQREQLRGLRGELQGAGVNTRKLAQAQADLDRRMGAVNAKVERAAQQAGKLQKAQQRFDGALQAAANVALIADPVARGSRALTGVLRSPIREAIDFESAMAEVRKVVDFDEPDGLAKLASRLRQMAKEIPITKEGLAEIAAAGGQLGVEAGGLPAFVETAARMSIAFDLLPQEAGDAMAKLSNIYQIPIREMDRLGDAVNHLSDNTAARARDIVPVLTRIGGDARQFGLTTVEAAALADAMIALGRPPEVAATAINALLKRMQTATRGSRDFQRGLLAIGVDAHQLERDIGQDAQGALSSFLERLGTLEDQKRAGVLRDLFGDEFSDDIALLVGSLDQYRKALRLVGEESVFAGSMEREFQNRANTTANKIQLLQNRWDDLQQRIGDRLLPVLDKLIRGVGPIIENVGQWIERNPKLTQTLVTLTAAVGALGLIAAPVITGVAAMVAALAVLRLALNKTAASAVLPGGKGAGGRGVAGLFRRLGVVGAAGGAGFVAGTALHDRLIRGTRLGDAFGDTLGGVVDRGLAFFGNDDAQRRLDILRGPTTTFGPAGQAIVTHPTAAARAPAHVNVNSPITIEAAPGVDVDTLADQLSGRMADIFRSAMGEAQGFVESALNTQ